MICKSKPGVIKCVICGALVCGDCNVNGVCLNCLRGKRIKNKK